MANFSSKYTNANIAQDAAQYESGLFLRLHENLAKLVPSESLATAITTVVLCAQARGDAVVRLFRDVTSDKPESEVREIFSALREAITLAVPFVGLPNTMPACFGLVGELKTREIDSVDGPRRPTLEEFDYTSHGQESITRIYRGVGNPEVRQMIQQYFPGMSYYGRTAIWGYLVGSSPVFELKHAEILVAASIAGLGAVRQVRSHVKCAISVGNSVDLVGAVIGTAKEVSSWNRRPLSGDIDIAQLAEELERNLKEE